MRPGRQGCEQEHKVPSDKPTVQDLLWKDVMPVFVLYSDFYMRAGECAVRQCFALTRAGKTSSHDPCSIWQSFAHSKDTSTLG